MSNMNKQRVFVGSVCCSEWCPDPAKHEHLHGEIEYVAKMAKEDPTVLKGADLGQSRVATKLSNKHGTAREYADEAARHVRDAMKRAGQLRND